MFKVHIAPTPNFVITFIRHDLFATRKSASRKKYRVPQDILGKAVYTYVSKRWECVLSCAREPVYWLLYHQNRNSMPASPTRIRMWLRMWMCVNLHTRVPTHVLFPDARRNYLQEAAWVWEKSLSLLTKSRSCVYISRTRGESLAIIAYDISPDDDKWETLLSKCCDYKIYYLTLLYRILRL